MNIPIFSKYVEYTLKLAGLWPHYDNIFGIILMWSPLFTIMPFQMWNIRQFDEILFALDNLSEISAEIMLYSKLLIIWYNRRELQTLLIEMAKDYEDECQIKYWSEFISTSCRFSRFDYALYASTCSLYYLQFILTYSKIPVENREMMLKSYYPFDFKRSPVYEIMTGIQIVQGLVMCTIQALSESLLVALVLHACGHIDLLFQKIDEFSENCRNGQEQVSIEPMANQHLKVLNIVQRVETVYTYASFIQVFTSTIMICISGLIILTIDDLLLSIKFGMLCLTVIWQGYSFCYFGQRLINKSEQISNKIYNTFWYRVSPKEIQAISYMINKAQSPLTLTAGKFTSLSTQTFTAMMKTSFSYVSVLRATVT